jgi:hypothetical protein
MIWVDISSAVYPKHATTLVCGRKKNSWSAQVGAGRRKSAQVGASRRKSAQVGHFQCLPFWSRQRPPTGWKWLSYKPFRDFLLRGENCNCLREEPLLCERVRAGVVTNKFILDVTARGPNLYRKNGRKSRRVRR